jgi:hypothetical protein
VDVSDITSEGEAAHAALRHLSGPKLAERFHPEPLRRDATPSSSGIRDPTGGRAPVLLAYQRLGPGTDVFFVADAPAARRRSSSRIKSGGAGDPSGVSTSVLIGIFSASVAYRIVKQHTSSPPPRC